MAGYAGGYTTDFRRLASSIHQRLSAYYVDSSLAEFSDAGVPRGNMQHMLAHLDRLAHAPQKTWVKVTASALHGLGDEALMETAQTKGKLPVYELIIFFRRGRYSETITVYGTSRPSTSSGVQLARLVDARIKHGS